MSVLRHLPNDILEVLFCHLASNLDQYWWEGEPSLSDKADVCIREEQTRLRQTDRSNSTPSSCNNVTLGAESSQSGSHVTTTNYDFTSSDLTSITALGSSSSTPQSRRYVQRMCIRYGTRYEMTTENKRVMTKT